MINFQFDYTQGDHHYKNDRGLLLHVFCLLVYIFVYTYFPLYSPRRFYRIIEYSFDQFITVMAIVCFRPRPHESEYF